jgi:hypothetical protein
MLGGDPVPWLLSSNEPAARWLTLTAVLDRALTDPAVLEARQELCQILAPTNWSSGCRTGLHGYGWAGHDSPAFAPHVLNLLADMGVRAGDFDRVEALLDGMLAHQEPSGRVPVVRRAAGRLRADLGLAAL